MAQDRIKINGIDIWQPDKGLQHAWETTYTEDSTRTQAENARFTPLFTVEQESYSATNIPVDKATEIIRQIIRGTNFTLHYYSLYYGKWRDDIFYVGEGDCTIGDLSENEEYLESLSFNMTGVNPI